MLRVHYQSRIARIDKTSACAVEQSKVTAAWEFDTCIVVRFRIIPAFSKRLVNTQIKLSVDILLSTPTRKCEKENSMIRVPVVANLSTFDLFIA